MPQQQEAGLVTAELNSNLASRFTGKAAQDYDARIRTLIPGYDALLELAGSVLRTAVNTPCPHVLLSGVGTGNELITLCELEPGWSFVGIDPSADMLDITAARLSKAGLADHISLHCTDLERLKPASRFDLVCSMFVSHFIANAGDKLAYYRSLRSHLKPGGSALIAELTLQPGHLAAYKNWLMEQCGSKHADKVISNIGKGLHPLPKTKFSSLLKRSGFSNLRPVASLLGYEMLVAS